MAAFRKGHIKVVKWLVKHVHQFPSDSECTRFVSTLSDKVRFSLLDIVSMNFTVSENALIPQKLQSSTEVDGTLTGRDGILHTGNLILKLCKEQSFL